LRPEDKPVDLTEKAPFYLNGAFFMGLHSTRRVKIQIIATEDTENTKALAANNANNTKVKNVLSLQGRICMDSLKPNICVIGG